jgi:integrase
MAGYLRKRGNKWYYSFEAANVNGKRIRVERVGGSTKKEAERSLNAALHEYHNSGLLFEPSEVSVSDYLHYWIDNYAKVNCKPNTIISYSRIVNKHLIPALGFYKLKTLTPATLQELINKKYLTGISKNYLGNIFAVLNSALKYAVYPCSFIRDNPMQYVSMPRYEHSKIVENKKMISIDTFNTIIERFPVGTTFHIMLMLGFYTGCRIGEVCSLTWDDVDFVNRTIDINTSLLKINKNWYFGSTKTKSSVRTITIGNTLINALKEQKAWQDENRKVYGPHYIEQYEFKEVDGDNILRRIRSIDGNAPGHLGTLANMICTKENGTMATSDSFKYASRVIHYELGINFNFHSLRHTHASLLIQNGAVPKDVQLRLGHSKINTTLDTYTHGSKKLSQQTTDLFEQLAQKKSL